MPHLLHLIETAVYMGNTKADMPADGWIPEDFVELPGTDLVADDPWSDPPNDAQKSIVNPLSAVTQPTMFDVVNMVDEGITVGNDTEQTTIHALAKQVADIPVNYGESGSIKDDLLLYELDDDLETDLELSLDEFEDDTEVLDEPEPFAEYDSELADPLYEPSDYYGVSGLEIRLDHFISRVRLSETEQLEAIRSILSGFSSARLSNWLSWLETKEWNDRNLLLFLEFRELWDSNPDWWERWTWIRRRGPRTTHTNASVLNRDSTYDLIQSRLECEPDEIIDSTWFDEWDYYAMWKHGFYSFASFAMFRAQIKDDEDWKRLVTWNLYDGLSVEWIYTAVEFRFRGGEAKYMIDQSAGKLYVWEADIPHRAYPSGPPDWFAMQDWYDAEEWHDNLGWAANGIELTHPNISSQSTQGSLWPKGGRNV